jgi:hypothetical protein
LQAGVEGWGSSKIKSFTWLVAQNRILMAGHLEKKRVDKFWSVPILQANHGINCPPLRQLSLYYLALVLL